MNDLPDLVHEATLDTIERIRLEERARIIKLLEQRATLMGKCKDTECVCRQSAIDFEYAIELIKGQAE